MLEKKYYEIEFKVKDFTFRFKRLSPIDILAIANDIEIYAGNYDTGLYKKYLSEVLENTEVSVNGKWLPVKEGNNYYPVSLADDYRSLREIVNRFFKEVITPVFTESSESSTEQE